MARKISLPNPKKTQYTYDELYKEYWKNIQLAFFFSERDWHIAEDLAQETMLRVWSYWDRIQWDKLGGAIGTIANNVRYRHLQKEFDRVDIESYDDILEFESHDEGITDPLREVLNDENAKVIQEAFSRLSESDAELFADIYLRNLKTSEVAEKHKTSVGNVFVRLYRVRGILSERLSRLGVTMGGVTYERPS